MQRKSILKIKPNFSFLAIILICVLGIAAYSNTFFNSFHFDDRLNIISNSTIKSLSNLNALWNFRPSRFITFLTFALNYKIGGLDVFGYHIVNLIIHLISALLVFWFVRLTFKTPVMNNTKIFRYSEIIALFSSLIFLLHPIQTESVTYIYQRCASLAGLFYLLSLCLYIKTRLLIETEDKSLKWLIYLAISFLFCSIAIFTKENTITLPLIIIIYEFCFFKIKRVAFSLFYLIFIPIVPIIFIIYKITDYTTLSKITGIQISVGDYFFTQIRVVITYLRLLFIPINQNFDYDYSISKGLFDFRVILSLIIIVSVILIAIRIFKKYKLLSFGIFWFFITLIPESSFIRIDDVIYEHRLYLPMLGFGIFLTSLFFYLLPERKLRITIFTLSAIITIMLGLTYNRNVVWKDGIILWSDAIKNSPHKARAYNERGVVFIDRRDYVNAVSDLNMAIELNPKYLYAYNNCGNAYSLQGKISEAIAYFTKAIELNPSYAGSYYNLANAYGVRGNFKEAIKYYSLALRISPNFAQAYNNRAYYYFLNKEYLKAIRDIETAKNLGYNVDLKFLAQLNMLAKRVKNENNK